MFVHFMTYKSSNGEGFMADCLGLSDQLDEAKTTKSAELSEAAPASTESTPVAASYVSLGPAMTTIVLDKLIAATRACNSLQY